MWRGEEVGRRGHHQHFGAHLIQRQPDLLAGLLLQILPSGFEGGLERLGLMPRLLPMSCTLTMMSFTLLAHADVVHDSRAAIEILGGINAIWAEDEQRRHWEHWWK